MNIIFSKMATKCLFVSLVMITCAGVSATKPNIIFILADDLGVECLGSYGSTFYKTPNLDKLATSGMRFTRCYAGPSCTPSRIALMTGKYNHRNYINFAMMPPGERTVGHMLQTAGYRTCVVEKWQLHLGREGVLPAEAGFDEHCLKAENTYWNAAVTENGALRKLDGTWYGPDVCNEYALKFIEANQNRPFFLYYAFNLPHFPHDATPDSPDIASRNDKRNFPSMVTYMDKLVGRMLKKIEDLGLERNTLVIFTGDNGTDAVIESPWRGGVRRGGKGSRRMQHSNVPLLISWPGTVVQGKVCDELVDFTDIYPTLAEAAGVLAGETELDGRSLMPPALGKPHPARDWVVSYFKGRDRPANKNAGFFWIGNQHWKLDHTGNLFHLANDPLEERPIWPSQDTAESKAVREAFSAALAQLKIDCRNLWVLDQSTVGTKGKKPNLKLYGQPVWNEKTKEVGK